VDNGELEAYLFLDGSYLVSLGVPSLKR